MRAALQPQIRRFWPLLALVIFVGVVGLACSAGAEDFQRRATTMLVQLVFVLGLYVFTGNTGVLSFGHVSFMAVGAYTSGLLTANVDVKGRLLPNAPEFIRDAHWPTIPSVILGGIFAAILAAILAIPLMRLAGLAAGIATLAVLVITFTILSHTDNLTGGQTALNGIPLDTNVYSGTVWAIIAIVVAYVYQQSKIGLRVQATREDPIAARALGISVYRERGIAFVISAFFAGVSGALYGHFLGSIFPKLFYFPLTFLTIAMLVVGGIYSLSGAVIGTVFISALQEGLRQIELGPGFIPERPGLTQVGLGVCLLLILIFLGGVAVVYWAEAAGNPILHHLGVPGGNMEGKEVRFGIAASALFSAVTTAASCGAVNAMHDSFTALGGMIPLFNIQLGEVVIGGVGAGIYGFLLFAILAVFVAGLMVGRTPEYVGKKIEAREVKLAVLAIAVLPLSILGLTAIASVLPDGLAGPLNKGPHGFSEILYAFTSGTGNNGSAFAGLTAATPFYDGLLGLAMWVGRFFMIVPMLAIAGSLAAKKYTPESAGSFPTTGPLWVGLLVGIVLILGGLTFLPGLALGPIAEHLAMLRGQLF